MMEKITAQEALHRLANRYKKKIMNHERTPLIGLDINEYTSLFRNGLEVTAIEFIQEGDSLAGTLMSHKKELLQQIPDATVILLQIVAAKGYALMMEEINELAVFVDLLGEDINFYWEIEYEDTTKFNVKIVVYIIK